MYKSWLIHLADSISPSVGDTGSCIFSSAYRILGRLCHMINLYDNAVNTFLKFTANICGGFHFVQIFENSTKQAI